MKNKIIGVCPNCGANLSWSVKRAGSVRTGSAVSCCGRIMRSSETARQTLDAHVADKLLRDGRVRLKDCKSAKGKTYNATVLLSCEADGRSKFSLEFEGGC